MGSNDSSSQSRPLYGSERADVYRNAIGSLFSNGDSATQYLPDEYTAPQFVGSGAANTLSGQDYDKLQNDTLQGSIAGLDYAKGKDIANFNNSAGAKGIWSSGLALRGEDDINAQYAPQYEKAGADATALRYNLQSGENQGLNAYQQANSAAQNQFNTSQNQQAYESRWRPADYLAGLWNGTGGTVSSGTSGGYSI